MSVGDLVVDPGARRVRRGDAEIELTAREFDILHLLAARAGKVVSRFTILDEVWDGETDLRSNVIDVYLASHPGQDRPAVRHPTRSPPCAAPATASRPAAVSRSGASALGRWPLRVRLVAGFAAAMLVLLAAAGAFVYWRVEYALDRGLDTELARRAATHRATGRDRRDASPRPTAADATGAAWQVLDADGAVLDRRGLGARRRPLVPRARSAGSTGTRRPHPRRRQPAARLGRALPGAGHPARTATRRRTSLVGVRRDHRDEALRELLLQLAVGRAAAPGGGLAGRRRLARAALRPVERYRRRAAEIAGGADRRCGWTCPRAATTR